MQHRRYTIILAKTPQEAITYARRVGLGLGQYRYAARAGSVSGVRVADIIELPGFANRPDRFAINAVLRYVRGERVKVEPPPPDRRLPFERALEVAYRYVAIKEAADGAEAGETEQSQDPAPAAKVESPAAERSKRKPTPQARKPKVETPEEFF